jgi:hypothetical protein
VDMQGSETAVRTALIYYIIIYIRYINNIIYIIIYCVFYVYIALAAYIQGLYTVYNGAGVQGAVAVLVLPQTRGVGSLHSIIKSKLNGVRR